MMENTLKDTELFKSMFECSAQGILLTDGTGAILRANDALHNMFGYETGELMHKNLEGLIPKEQRKKHKNHRRQFAKNPASRTMGKEAGIWGLKKDGSQLPLSISLCPTKIENEGLVIAFVSDDTDRMLAHLAIKTNEKRMAEAQSIAHVGSWSWNLLTNERLWSDEFYRIYGLYPGDERLNTETTIDFIHPEDREASIQRLANAIEQKVPYVYEKRIVRPDGSVRQVLAKGKVEYNRKGEAVMIKGTMQDITVLKEAVFALKKEKELLQKYLDTAASIFLVINKEHIVELVNQKGCEVLDSSSDEIVGKNWFDNFIPKRDRKKLMSFFDDVIKGKTAPPDHFENPVLDVTGKEKLVQWRNSILTDEKGKAIAILSSGSDITNQKKAEQELHLVEEKNRKELKNYAERLEEKVKTRTQEVTATVQRLVESNLSLKDQVQETQKAENKLLASQTILSGIVENFPKGIVAVISSSFELLYTEGQALDELGLRSVFFDGLTVDDVTVVSEEHKTAFKKNVAETIAGQHLSFETEYRNHYFAVNTTPLYDKNEKVTSALFVYSDITEQKKTEQNIQNALKAEQELNELKSRFISMASHEFRTPLSAILSSAILIGKQNEPGKEERREKHVNRIKDNVKNLVIILNDFLSLSKLEEGKVKVHPEHFDLIAFVHKLIEEIETSKKAGQSIHLTTSVTAAKVFLDPKLMNHILINLLSNAIKYSPEGKKILFNIDFNKKNVLIKITDQGIGIPEDEQGQLFERFFRAKNATNIQGTGLGLHIVKQYTELMGGTVHFESKANDGTTFYIDLPLQKG